MKSVIVTAVELACVAVIGVGLAMIYVPLGLIVPAVLLLVYMQRFG